MPTVAEKVIAGITLATGAFIGIIAIMVIESVLNAWALTKLWAWFIVPYFGFLPLCIPVAIGISFIVTFLTYKPNKDDTGGITFLIFKPIMFVLFGWVVHTYFMPTDMKPMWHFNEPPAKVAPAIGAAPGSVMGAAFELSPERT